MFPISWVQAGIAAAAAFALSWLISTVVIDGIEAKHRAEMAAQEAALNEACDKSKAITKEAQDGLQKQVDIIGAKLRAAKRLRPLCVIPVASDSKSANGGGEHAGQNGVSSDWLREFSADCETYRQQRITLEKFISDERSGATR